MTQYVLPERPDCVYATRVCSRQIQEPTHGDLASSERTTRCLSNAEENGLRLHIGEVPTISRL
eukprot:8101182-Alexandrium_andersonii.AAC.1